MSYGLVIQSEAIIDIQEAFEWHEAKKPGLGFELIEEIGETYEKICKHPLHYTAINNRFKRLKVNRFSYVVVYEIDGDNIIVNAVRRTSRKEKF